MSNLHASSPSGSRSATGRHHTSPKTVVVLGAAYGGARAARMLAQTLPQDWRLVVIDRNSHMNHVYVFPRFSLLPDHAPKAFIPYTKMLDPPDPTPSSSDSTPTATSTTTITTTKIPTPPLTPSSSTSSLLGLVDTPSALPMRTFIQGTVTSLTAHSVSFIRPASRRTSLISSKGSTTTLGTYDFEGPEETVDFEYCIYALGSGMPDPCNVWSEHPNLPPGIDNDEHLKGLGSKKCGISWMEQRARDRKEAKRILIVGGGALGIQFATDLKEIYPEKEITLLHSRQQLMSIYPRGVHIAAMDALSSLGVNVVLGERVMVWPEDPEHLNGKTKTLITDKGREFHADLVLPCTGQKPHTSFIASLSPSSISPKTDRIRVHPTMQLRTDPIEDTPTETSTSIDQLSNLSLNNHPANGTGNGAGHGNGMPTPPSSEYERQRRHHPRPSGPDLRHMFAIGDCAETGAIQAGHTAYWQAEVAARNLCRLIERQEGRAGARAKEGKGEGEGEEEVREALESYKPGLPCIKLTLGLKGAVTATGNEVSVSQDGVEDLKAMLMWPMLAAGDCDPKE